jgi:hypothetical protein
MTKTKILAFAMLAAVAVVAASATTFGTAFAQQSQDNDQDFSGGCNEQSSCRNNQINQNNNNGDNNVGDVNFN